MNSLWDIRIFLGLVPKEPHCVMGQTTWCPGFVWRPAQCVSATNKSLPINAVSRNNHYLLQELYEHVNRTRGRLQFCFNLREAGTRRTTAPLGPNDAVWQTWKLRKPTTKLRAWLSQLTSYHVTDTQCHTTMTSPATHRQFAWILATLVVVGTATSPCSLNVPYEY